MNFYASDVLINLKDCYIRDIIVYDDYGLNLNDDDNVNSYYSIVKIIFNDHTIQTITLSHDEFYPTNEITFAKSLLNNLQTFNAMTKADFTTFVDEVNEQKTDTAKNFRDTLIAMKPKYS